ncbi:hypothetical protein L6468_00770 [Prevotella communis]|uniref:hypothetical protein n=1 Tax=Prevotella communis TaxID=2913614 RepID=UPI001EDBBC35|nr:hypothetical protein [Prevotella communis]UKK62342.1 hypothetical protein L6468_00770 [Prevotella communis]UKK65169.1 hypothetical protein L6473_00770 [Prevotella communis]
MKLFFKKDEHGEIILEIQKGTVRTGFDYVEMLRQLLEHNEIEEPVFEKMDDEEITKVKELLAKIKNAVAAGLAKKI